MRNKGQFIAIGLLFLVNTFVLAGVAYNRSGDPDASITVSERELPVAQDYENRENSGISLRINVNHSYYSGKFATHDVNFSWLDRKKLESLGFDFSKPAIKDEKFDFSRRELPRRTFAVLEFEGNAWRTWQKRQSEELALLDKRMKEGKETEKDAKAERKAIEREIETGSRLFIIDAGNDPLSLRQQYPDRTHYLILPTTVSVFYQSSSATDRMKEPIIHGRIELLITEIQVPKDLRIYFDASQGKVSSLTQGRRSHEAGTKYNVILKSGKRYEPWIAGIMKNSV